MGDLEFGHPGCLHGLELLKPSFMPLEGSGRLDMPRGDQGRDMGLRADRRQDDPLIEVFQVERGIPPSPPIASQCGHHG
jgi:hypothetical protein